MFVLQRDSFEQEAINYLRLGQKSKLYPIPEVDSSGFRLRIPSHVTSNELVIILKESFYHLAKGQNFNFFSIGTMQAKH